MSNDRSSSEGSRTGDAKLPYAKPMLEFIELHSDQVLADTCKSNATTSGAATGATGCASRGCYANGDS